MTHTMRIQRVTGDLRNDVVGDSSSHRGNQQTQNIVSEPPGHVCLVQTGQVQPFRHVTNQEHDHCHEHAASEEPVGGVDTLSTAVDHGHPNVQAPWHHHHEGDVQINRPDVVGILTARGHTGPQQRQSKTQTHIIQHAVPHAELLGPQLGVTQSRGDVHHGGSESHGNPAENHGMNVNLTHMTELQRVQTMEQVRKCEFGSIE